MKLVAQPILKTIALALTISAFILIGFVSKPVAAVTTTSTNLESQMAMIQKLLEQIQLLQKQLLAMQGGGSDNAQKNTCLTLNTNLGYRSADSFSNSEVSALQDFLQAKGYLNSAPTGFYGMMTSEAVKSFQAQNGIEATGYLGNETRAKIKTITCTQPSVTPPIACTMDAMMCPDGSSVGRVAPSCNFAACPKTTVALPKPKITSVEFLERSPSQPMILHVRGPDLGFVVKLEYRVTFEQLLQPNEGILYIREKNLGKGSLPDSLDFALDKYLGGGGSLLSSLKVRVVDSQGQASSWETVKLQEEIEEPSVDDVSFLEFGQDTEGKRYNELHYTIKNLRSGIVLDVEPTVICNDSYLGGRYRNCAEYLFDFARKAGEQYLGVQGDPYVKGGALYRFPVRETVREGDVIFITSYVNPKYSVTGNEVSPEADSVLYKFILRDINDGGAELWSRDFLVVHEG